MTYNYTGIAPESIELLCLNRFHDSKTFYEAHKEQLKEGIIMPMRQMVLDMADVLYAIDEKMYLEPVRVVSRIHRDTRGNRSKIKYRENMWTFFRRYKKAYPQAPFYYFEFYPERFGYGLVLWTRSAACTKIVHEMILENPRRFKKAVRACADAGFHFWSSDVYKTDRYPHAPKELKPFLAAKNFGFSYESTEMERINSTAVIDEMRFAFQMAAPMYAWMTEAHQRMMLEGLIQPEE